MSATDGKITLTEAIAWTGNWRKTPSTKTNAFLIPVKTIEGVLSEIKAQGSGAKARAYLGIDDKGEETLVFVGTKFAPATPKEKEYYKDLLPAANETTEAGANGIWDFVEPCPPYCDDSSPLN
tara:strand:+ start:33 stop:401 length:369 start_codon:yes stop_codon:yes gene_type:complete